MRIGRCVRLGLVAACAALMAMPSFATVLVSEGCDTANDYAGVTTSGNALLGAFPKSTNASTGIYGSKWCGYGSQPRTYLYDLPLPSCFANTSLSSKGAACVGMNRGSNATDHRWAYLQLADNVLKVASGTTLYFRGLINIDSGAAGALSKPSSDTIGGGNSFGFGLTTRSSNYGKDSGTPMSMANNLSFYYWKNSSGKLVLSVRAVDAAGKTSSKRLIDGLTAPTESGIAAANTFICYAEIQVGAGADGKEVIRAGAVNVNAYDSSAISWSDSFEAEIISDTAYPTFLDIVGDYCVNGWAVMDEFVVATEMSEALVLAVEGAPKITNAALAGDSGSYTVTADVSLASATDAGAIAHDGANAGIVLSAGAVTVEEGSSTTFTKVFSNDDLSGNKTYKIFAYAKNDEGSVSNAVGTIYAGTLTLTKVKDANEYGCEAGEVTVSRAAADPYPLTVNYTLSSEAEGAANGNTWVAPVPVTIPAGETSATLTLTPKVDTTVNEDITVTLALAAGAYVLPENGVDLTIYNLKAPEGYNTWIASADGNASVADNWSEGRVPTATDNVLFDGNFTTANCEWDGGVNGLATTVASWTQRGDYTGTVTVETTYDTSFPALTVTGNLALESGVLTHKANSDAETYRLKVLVGGDVTIASAATIDAAGKGFAANKYRPGSALGCHASPMGSAGVDKLYGDMKKPEALGSGNAKGSGGGAVYIEAAGVFSNDGAITVASAGGAAGSIYIKAASVTGSGTYTARTPDSLSNDCQVGSGGRIAFELTTASTITENEDVFINGKCAAGFSFGGRSSAAGGTIFVKSPTRANGVLYVSGQSGSGYYYTRLSPEFRNMLAIPAGESWVLDGLVFLNSPIAGLRIFEGTTLSLPSGLASVKAYGSGGGIGGLGGNIATGNRGLVVDGGSLVLPSVAEHLIANGWTLQANKPYTLTGDVRVNASGRIGVVAGYGTTYAYTNRCDLAVTGDLTVESKGYIDATGAGWKNYNDAIPAGLDFSVRKENGAHGGVSKNHTDVANYAYDSILNPMLPGEGSQSGDGGSAKFGGGCVKLTIGGKLTLAGSATALSPYQDVSGGAGGTINITCGSIEGAGTINVTTQSGYGGTQGGGGRVAIRLTDEDADFTDYPLSRIVVAQSGDQSSGGTIYLQTAAEGENGGTVYIKGNASNTATVMTPFPSLYGGGENDDFRKVTLAITSNGKAILSSNARAMALNMASGTLDLNGKTLKVSKATLGETKLATGTYTASSEEVAGYVTDSGTGGSLVVTGSGLVVIFR